MQIDNPEYFTDPTPLVNTAAFSGVGIEIWTMTNGIFFDNILIATDPIVAVRVYDCANEMPVCEHFNSQHSRGGGSIQVGCVLGRRNSMSRKTMPPRLGR
eukprot:SAG11_NODE_11181_length_778_cov_1.082474_2_plen_100_part_00